MIPYAKEAGGVLLLVLLTFSHGFACKQGGKGAKAELAEHKAAYERQLAHAIQVARKAEQDHAAAMARVAIQHEQDKADAQAKHDRVVADIRSGQLRLRKQWTCPASEAGATPGESDGAARLREQDAADLVRAAAEADAQVRGLQRVIEADRK